MRIGTIKVDHVRGFADKLVGLNMEWVGTVINNDRLQEAGEAQQARGTRSLKALRREARPKAKAAKSTKSRTTSSRPRTTSRAKAR
jgi:uncharacterized protein YjbJ (UPF0337 family)